jgi:proteasome lid subunit RPN8/RPN11
MEDRLAGSGDVGRRCLKRLRFVVVERVIKHARRTAPEECCGLLIGGAAEVVEAVAARNIADQRAIRFVIDPQDHLDALRSARRRGLEVVGFYHSHPRSTATPSETDLAEANYPHHLFLIVGLGPVGLGPRSPEIRLYEYSAGSFLRIGYVVSP